MEEHVSNEESRLVVKAKSIIDKHVKDKEEEIIGKARLIAAIAGAVTLIMLSRYTHSDLLGNYTSVWAGMVGFIAGTILGQPITFAAIGSAITYMVMSSHHL